jgi:hypothetical protein
MTRNKPEVLELDSAMTAIKGTYKDESVLDHVSDAYNTTLGAYRSDK